MMMLAKNPIFELNCQVQGYGARKILILITNKTNFEATIATYFRSSSLPLYQHSNQLYYRYLQSKLSICTR